MTHSPEVGTRVHGQGRGLGVVTGDAERGYPVVVRWDASGVESLVYSDDPVLPQQHLTDEVERQATLNLTEAGEYRRNGLSPRAPGRSLVDRVIADRVERGVYSEAEALAIRLTLQRRQES